MQALNPKMHRSDNAWLPTYAPALSFEVQLSRVRTCAGMLGADFACPMSDGKDVDSCQLHRPPDPGSVCSKAPGCNVALTTHGWATLKSAMNFSLAPQTAATRCKQISQKAVERARSGQGCDAAANSRWQSLKCASYGRPVSASLAAIAPRPRSLTELFPASTDLKHFTCVPDVQLKNPQLLERHASPYCIKPSPTKNTRACCLLRKHALRVCLQIQGCHVLHCERTSDYCQALRGHYRLNGTKPSFGDVDLLVRRGFDRTNQTGKPANLCVDRHYHATASKLGAHALHFGLRTSVLDCTVSGCKSLPATEAQLEESGHRLKEILITSAQRFSTRSTAAEPSGLFEESGPLMLYEPASTIFKTTAHNHENGVSTFLSEYPSNPRVEQDAYHEQYGDDRWLTDVQQAYRRFFGPKTNFYRDGRKGYFVESGAGQGAVFDSNSIFFERFLGWSGLLVEANPFSFAKLVVRRPAAYRLETALCARPGELRFQLPDHQRNADGCCGRADGAAKHVVRCTPLGAILDTIGIHHVDFWSLDVEGAELDVLQGFDWAHNSLSVLLIEVYPRLDESYSHFLSARGLVRLRDFKSPTGLNQVWFNRSLISPV